MAKIEWVELRLQNWARWRLAHGGDGCLGYAAVDLLSAGESRRGYVEAVVPISDVEATDTDAAINTLVSTDRLAVYVWYVHPGGLQARADAAGCALSTLKARVAQAHRVIGDYIMDLQASRKAARARVETLQALARPGSASSGETPPRSTP